MISFALLNGKKQFSSVRPREILRLRFRSRFFISKIREWKRKRKRSRGKMGKNMSKKRILVTGAAGFIGFHAAQELAGRGDHVLGYDNFNDYYSPELKRRRAKILQDKGIAIIEADVCDATSLQQAVENHQTTHFLHLAAQAGVRYSLSHPQAYVKANIEGFVNVLEVCRQHPGMPLIYASSSSVYGRNDKTPFAETDRVDGQASLYGVTKRTNELLANTYHHLYGVPVTGLRFFTAYGPWGRPDMAYFSFTKAIIEGRPIDVFNHGNVKRDFTYIDDVIHGIVSALDLGASCEIFNLGNNRPVSVNDFISILEKLLGKTAQKRFLPMQAGDVVATCADLSHSSSCLGFVPKTSLEEGLRRFVEWYKGQ